MKRPAWLTRRRAILIASGVALAGAVVYALRPTPLEVETGRVARGTLRVTVRAEATTRVRNRYTVSAPVTARLARIPWEAGDPVVRGAVVARLGPPPLDERAQVQAVARARAALATEGAAAAEVERMEAELTQARRDLARAQALEGIGGMSRMEREHAATTVRTRQRELDAATHRAETARQEAAAARAGLLGAAPERSPASAVTEVRSPVTGRVLRVLEEDARVVPAGTPLLELGDPADLEVVVDVLSADAVEIRPGNRVTFTGWGGTAALAGTVTAVEPTATTEMSTLGIAEQRVDVIVALESVPTALGDGYELEAEVVTWEGVGVVKVPASALFRRAGGWAVFVVADGRARLRRVVAGRRGTLEVEVARGLAPGEVVIVHPNERIRHGARVRPQR